MSRSERRSRVPRTTPAPKMPPVATWVVDIGSSWTAPTVSRGAVTRFDEDFAGAAGSVPAFVARCADEPMARAIGAGGVRPECLDYDWS